MSEAIARIGRRRGGVSDPIAHDSAHMHVAGDANYIDDLKVPDNCLDVFVASSSCAHGEVAQLDLSAVRAAPGVVAVVSAEDIPGRNDVSPVAGDDPLFADGLVQFHGQSLFAVGAETTDVARAAAAKAKLVYKARPAILTIDEAMARRSFVIPPIPAMRTGDAAEALAAAPHRRSGRLYVGGQEHFYLEGQVSLAIPGEDGDMHVYSSTQHPSELQEIIAHMLDRPFNAVTVELRRMGGAFGGKESQAALFAAAAALIADRTGRPAKVCVDRDDDMTMTGKRHDFRIDYDVGFDDDGRITGITMALAARCGYSADLSAAIIDRAMFHADNCYYLPNAEITAYGCKTNTVSNTAFRGFGGPQGMIAIERVIDEIAFHLGRDPLDVRKLNFYGGSGRDMTHYHMPVEDNVIGEIVAELEQTADYAVRRAAIDRFNAVNRYVRKGLALTPVKFGISFTTSHLNQAGALVHVYKDGSVHLNHGGTEMGQGLFTKIAQVVAEEFQIDVDNVKITATTTGKVPNTSATAASSGTDMNGMAARAASAAIRERLIAFGSTQYKVAPEEIVFENNRVRVGNQEFSFAEFVNQAYLARISLSSTGFYRTPKIHYDRDNGRGRPFYYFAYGAAVSEVVVDVLTGEYRVMRVDILHDVGKSLNPAMDIGQIEGGFIQGMGWLTTEELCWDESGRLTTHAPSTYKIPACSDRPRDMRIAIWRGGENREPTIYRSKAVGEPPLMLGISVFNALTDAVAGVAGTRQMPALHAPATPEHVLMAIEEMTSGGQQ